MEFCKCMRIGPVYLYVSTRRLKGRYKHSDILRKNHKKLQRIKREKWKEGDGRCEECGKRFRIEEMELHHIVPLSKNAFLVTAISNLQLVCPECHARLHGRPMGGVNEFGVDQDNAVYANTLIFLYKKTRK